MGLGFPVGIKRILENYGYMDVNQNRNSFQLFQPDHMEQIRLQTDVGEVPIMVIGVFQDYIVGIYSDTKDLQVSFGEEMDDGTMWNPVNLNFSGMLATMLVSLLFQSDNYMVYDNEAEICEVLTKYGAEQSLICAGEGCPQHFSLNYNREKDRFLIAEFGNQDENITLLHIVPRRMLSLEELKQLFDKEFYQNAMNCDYHHALELQLKIIECLGNAAPIELAEHYKLAARCCWQLGQVDEASSWYDKGVVEVNNNLTNAFCKTAEYYHAMGNFYADIQQYDKSDQYYEMGLDILYQHFPEDAGQIGQIYQSRAQFLVKNNENLDKAIAFYNKALEEFQKKPKECKYDIARTQQLRGEAKRMKKISQTSFDS